MNKKYFNWVFLIMAAIFMMKFYANFSWLKLIVIEGFFLMVYVILKKISDEIKFKNSLTYIVQYEFPLAVLKKFRKNNPDVTHEMQEKVILALKQFFLVYAWGIHEKKGVSYAMPSLIADELWHEFMLNSKDYEDFCHRAFGRFLHHQPNTQEELISPEKIKLFSPDVLHTYKVSKKMETIFNWTPIASIPILFAIDSHLDIKNGFYYNSDIINKMELQSVSLERKSDSSCSSCSTGAVNSCSSSSCNSGCSCSSCSSCSSCGGC